MPKKKAKQTKQTKPTKTTKKAATKRCTPKSNGSTTANDKQKALRLIARMERNTRAQYRLIDDLEKAPKKHKKEFEKKLKSLEAQEDADYSEYYQLMNKRFKNIKASDLIKFKNGFVDAGFVEQMFSKKQSSAK